MSLIKPCAVAIAPLNTGVDCQIKMSAPAMYILVPAADRWTDADEVNFLTLSQTKIHEVAGKRWFPLFGNNAPVRTINDGKESDVIVTYDDGSQAFIRNGTITRTLMTNKGGLAYAQALMSFNRLRGFAFIEIDKFNNVLRKKFDDGTYGGVPLNMAYAPTPDNATLKDEFKPAFSINYTAENYIQKGVISVSTDNLLDLMGLINLEFTDATGASTTKLKVGLRTVGTNYDMVAAYPAVADLTTLVVTKKSDGTVVTPSAIAIVGGHLEITGVFTSGSSYIVSGSTPAALKALSPTVAGYEITGSVTLLIP